MNTNSINGTTAMNKEGTKRTAISGQKSVKPCKKAFAKVRPQTKSELPQLRGMMG